MPDDLQLAMTHHMAVEHEDIPTGVTEKTLEYTVRCRRCQAFFRDAFIRDLHETKVCSAPECDGCQVGGMLVVVVSKCGLKLCAGTTFMIQQYD